MEYEVAAAIEKVARALDGLGNADANTPLGGLEALGVVMKDGLGDIADALRSLAESVDRHGPHDD